MNITEKDLKRFAPRAHPEYVAALLGGIELMREAGILDNEYRVCHFMGQVGAETGGLTVIRESLMYITPKRLREVWPARFRNKSDIELAPLIRNPIALGDAVYGGRLGNTFPGDGYAFRGGGFLQTTGRAAVTRYCKACGAPFRPDALDDVSLTLKFACTEWKESGCNDWADENDLTKVSKAINTGSATGTVKPVGMTERQIWFAKAWSIWGMKGKPDVPKPPMSVRNVVTTSIGAAGTAAVVVPPMVAPVAEVIQTAAPAVSAAKPILETAGAAVKQAQETQAVLTHAKGVWTFFWADPLWIVAALVVFAGVAFVPSLLKR